MVLRICCHLVPVHCDNIVLKLCQFIHNALNSQQVMLVIFSTCSVKTSMLT